MYRILIAEDTSLIRRGIISMIHWEDHNCVLAGEASNGKEAIKMLDALTPDILLLDVKMPQLDGMKVLDYIRELQLPVKVIMISGYSNFEYVKHALRSNTVDYILKPIHEEELNQALGRAVSQLTANNSGSEICTIPPPELLLTTQLEENIYTTFGDLFASSDSDTLFWIASFKNKYNDYTFFRKKISSAASGTMEILYHEHADRMDVVFCSSLESDYRFTFDMIQKLYVLADNLVKNLLYVGFSHLHSADYIVTKAYYEAHKALCNKMLRPHQHLLSYADFDKHNYSLEDVFQSETTLLNLLLAGNNTEAIQLCQTVMMNHLKSPAISIDEFCMILTEFYCTLLKANTDHVDELRHEISSLHNLENLLNYDDYMPFMETLYQYCSLITDKVISHRTDIDSSIIEIQKYIQRHFSEPITLKSLENLFHLNASYISVSFKRITGTGINKYIRNLRMDYAVKLLSSTDLKMTEVCEKSGFSNYVHFSKEFKKFTGVSPSDYRAKQNNADG